MLSQEVVGPAQSEKASLIVFALKKDELLCFFVDYWKLKTMNWQDSYPIVKMEQRIDFLSEASVFSTLRDISGYW